MVSAAIFDMDGLLFDTERLCAEAWRSVAAERGMRIPEELFLSCVGRNARDMRAIVSRACGDDFPFDDFTDRTRAWMSDRMLASGPPEKPGIRVLFDYFSAKNVPIALATSTREQTARTMIEQARLTHYFSAFAFGNQVEHGKPFPDIFLLAMRRLGVETPSSCVVFEDSPAGLRAAHAAGMKPIFIRDTIDPDDETLSLVWKRANDLSQAAADSFYAELGRAISA